MAQKENQDTINRFPDHFVWGAATSALQVEGSLRADGAGESSWEHFTRLPGAIADGGNIDVACDHYRRWKEDIALLKELGVKAYRFSISWSRTFPEGDDRENPKALDFYQRLVDELLKNGITPYATLFHWETPYAIERSGGWLNKKTAYSIEKHGALAARKLGDRVKCFFTVNEAMGYSLMSFGLGVHAPGIKCSKKEELQSLHNAFLGHGVLLAAVRANAPEDVKVGIAENCIIPVPLIETSENNEAAKRAFRDMNANRIAFVLDGKYSDRFLERCGKDRPDYTDEELQLISAPQDMIGVNCYSGEHIVADPDRPEGYRTIPFPADYPKMHWDWFRYEPRSLYWCLRLLDELWPGHELFVTENGCPCYDRPNRETGRCEDSSRILYLRANLENTFRAVRENIPVKGYFAWSLLDNFEWAYGYAERFGLYHVDFNTGVRTPKLSADFYREVIHANKIF